VAAAVILDELKPIKGLKDSKVLTQKRREVLFDEIRAKALCCSIAEASATLNVRLLPGQSLEDLIARLRASIADDAVTVAIESRGEEAPPRHAAAGKEDRIDDAEAAE